MRKNNYARSAVLVLASVVTCGVVGLVLYGMITTRIGPFRFFDVRKPLESKKPIGEYLTAGRSLDEAMSYLESAGFSCTKSQYLFRQRDPKSGTVTKTEDKRMKEKALCSYDYGLPRPLGAVWSVVMFSDYSDKVIDFNVGNGCGYCP